jgi:Lipid A 3-O-deacylase (PagL)
MEFSKSDCFNFVWVRGLMKFSGLAGFVFLFPFLGSGILAQTSESRPISRRNTFGIYVEYSNDSSHMVMGVAENRKLVALGGSYALRLWRSHVGDLRYIMEARPVLIESDPVERDAETLTIVPGPTLTGVLKTEPVRACRPGTSQQTQQGSAQTIYITDTITCDRRWVFAQGFSPVGFQYGFRPGRRFQPLLTSTAGYVFSTTPIPVPNAGSFNFTFDVGAGFEWFRTKSQSIQFEYRYHHISNHSTADANPGIDNGVFKLTYAFGR